MAAWSSPTCRRGTIRRRLAEAVAVFDGRPSWLVPAPSADLISVCQGVAKLTFTGTLVLAPGGS